MRTMIDIVWHALELRLPSANEAIRWPRTVRRRNVAAALIFASMAGPLATERVSAASPGDNEIRIGNTMPYTGPASAYGVIGKVIAAYFEKINAEGGINGRKVKFISYDDAYDAAKTVELTRKLVEEDLVLLIFSSLGTAPSAAVRPYLNSRKVPQLFVASGASMWDQPREFPWTMGFQPSYQIEGHIYAQYLLENYPRGKIAVLYQDDAFGQDYVKGLKDGLGGKIPIVAEALYKVTDTTIDAQLTKLKASGADIFFDVTTPKFAVMAIRRTAEMGWKPVHIIPTVSQSISAVMQPAGPQNSEGVLSAGYTLEGDDPTAASDPVYRDWTAFMERYIPSASKANSLSVFGYGVAKTMVEVLTRCGDDLSRENVMKQAASLKGLPLPMLLPGIVINTSAHDHSPLEQMQMRRFTAGRWERFGSVRSGIDPGSVSESFKTIFRYGSAAKRDMAAQMNANTVTLVTGSFGSTYAQIGADLASVLDNGANLRVLPVLGRGSVQAVADILLLKGVDAGIVRKDTLAYLERKDLANNIRSQFVYVTKMFNEEMHVLAPRTIRNLKDLDGKTVVVDLPDASTFVTSINVFERLGIKPHLLYIEPRLALEMLSKGEIDAIVAVEGKPLQWLSQVRDPNLHLVPVGYEKPLQEEYLPSTLTSADYPNLISDGAAVDTIAAEAVLASYNWQPTSDRYRRLSLLVESLFTRVAQLQRPPFHPKWKEVALKAPVAGWTRFPAAQEWVDRHFPSAGTAAASAAVEVPRGSKQDRDDPLYREFLEWRANRLNSKR
jgi:branched-chain amino acid transport system substrate-binding protein